MTYTYRYPRPAVTVDLVVFKAEAEDQDLEVLLIERADPPFQGQWALPGGFVEVLDDGDQGESIDDAARRELEEETGLTDRHVSLEQLRTFGQPGRDPRCRTITVAYYALVREDVPVTAGSDAARARWFSVSELPGLAFDHDDIIAVGLRRIRGERDVGPRLSCE